MRWAWGNNTKRAGGRKGWHPSSERDPKRRCAEEDPQDAEVRPEEFYDNRQREDGDAAPADAEGAGVALDGEAAWRLAEKGEGVVGVFRSVVCQAYASTAARMAALASSQSNGTSMTGRGCSSASSKYVKLRNTVYSFASSYLFR